VDAQSTGESEYRTMLSLTCERVRIKQFLQELKFFEIQEVSMCCCDKQTAIHIATNPIFHEKTNIEIYCHFV